jgi:hypothetical protein
MKFDGFMKIRPTSEAGIKRNKYYVPVSTLCTYSATHVLGHTESIYTSANIARVRWKRCCNGRTTAGYPTSLMALLPYAGNLEIFSVTTDHRQAAAATLLLAMTSRGIVC